MSVQEMVEESKKKVLKFLQNQYEKTNTTQISTKGGWKVKEPFSRKVNKMLEKFNFHLMHWKSLRDLMNFGGNPMCKLASVEFYYINEQNPEKFETSYKMMSDEYSKRVFEWYVKYRTAYASIGEWANELWPSPFCVKSNPEDFLKDVKFTKDGIRIDGFVIKSKPMNIFNTFVVKQYEYFDKVLAGDGDVFIDVGTLAGDTALYFSKMVGEKGKVYAFEPVRNSYSLLVENINRNNAKNIQAVKLGLFSKNMDAFISNRGGSSAITSNGKGEKIKLVKLDSFVEKEELNKVDFIKMDIEGAELDALRGAEKTIKKYKPKLAICVYHKGRDMIDIPQYLKSLVPEYKFFLKHNTKSWSETVLYATARK